MNLRCLECGRIMEEGKYLCPVCASEKEKN